MGGGGLSADPEPASSLMVRAGNLLTDLADELGDHVERAGAAERMAAELYEAADDLEAEAEA